MSKVIATIKLEIPIPIRSNEFYIKRDSDRDFYLFRVDGNTSLYEGDILKVPPGSTVWVICQHNGKKVRVPDDNIPWPVTRGCGYH